MPEIAGLPFVITGLVMAGGLAAALSTADGLLLTIANAISHDLYYNVIDPKASLTKRLTITKVLLVVTALDRRVGGHLPASRSSSSWWPGRSVWPAPPSSRRWSWASGGSGPTRRGPCAGMIVGLGCHDLLHDREPILRRLVVRHRRRSPRPIFGLPVGFLTIWIVSLLTEAPSKEVQDLVVSVRYPKTGQATTGDPLGRDIPVGAH